MLYDPKWEATETVLPDAWARVKSEPLTKENMLSFMAWLETKPADEVYIFMDSENCACGQYARAIGVERWMDRHRTGSFWFTANSLAGAFGDPKEWVEKHTFGQLLERCRAHVRDHAHAA